jgi:hypothetical protein
MTAPQREDCLLPAMRKRPRRPRRRRGGTRQVGAYLADNYRADRIAGVSLRSPASLSFATSRAAQSLGRLFAEGWFVRRSQYRANAFGRRWHLRRGLPIRVYEGSESVIPRCASRQGSRSGTSRRPALESSHKRQRHRGVGARSDWRTAVLVLATRPPHSRRASTPSRNGVASRPGRHLDRPAAGSTLKQLRPSGYWLG